MTEAPFLYESEFVTLRHGFCMVIIKDLESLKGESKLKNIIDYVLEYGDQSFADKPFNEVDSLILSQLIYMDFTGLVPAVSQEKEDVSLTEVGKHVLREKMFRSSVGEKKNRKLFQEMEKSKRYALIGMNCYQSHIDISQEKQFAAVTFRISPDVIYLAFRGTDQHLVGWKEDFNMTYKAPIPAQIDSLKYIEEVGRRSETDRLIIGGHSKGGNLALYASIYCAKPIRDRIIRIFSHDGPGMRREIYQQKAYQELVPKIHKTVPQSSIVGQMLYQREESRIIYSNAYGLWQHDPYNWVVERGHFKSCEHLEKDAVAIDQALKKWLSETDDDKRSLFVNTLYEIICAAGISELHEMRENLRENLFAIIETTKNIDEDTRAAFHEVMNALLKNLLTRSKKEREN